MYSLLIKAVSLFLKVIALWNGKIRLFVDGRKDVLSRINEAVSGHDDIIWFHTASMGEFEEARPIIEATRKRFPDRKILLTFFSPSGYEPRKAWNVVDWVFYLPLDTASNARRFLDIVRPSKAIFTIGEFWFNYLSELRRRGVDTYIMSVRITMKEPYLKWYGAPYRKLLRTSYKAIMVKDRDTAALLEGIGCRNVKVVGDARFDRVISVAREKWSNPVVEAWNCGTKAFVAGSTCYKDDDLVISLANSYPDVKFLFIPHELDQEPIDHIVESVRNGAVVYSDVEHAFSAENTDSKLREQAIATLKASQVLIINKIGMLSKLYRYGNCALIGGGFINMPHSVIEASVYGMPVVMGPQYHKSLPFVELMQLGAAQPVSNNSDIAEWYRKLHDDPEYLARVSRIAYDYCAGNAGATDTIMAVIFGNGR